MHEYRIVFGIGERSDGSLIGEHEREMIVDGVKSLAAGVFGGGTLTQGEGGWVHPSGRLVCERSATLSILTDDSHTVVQEFASMVRGAANQHSVMLIHPDGSAEFVEG